MSSDKMLNNTLFISTKNFPLCSILRIIGYYFIVLWITGMILNGSVLYILVRNKKLRQSSTNILIGGLLLADLIGTYFEIPLPTFSLLSCRWIFTYTGCVFEAMIVYFAGCSNIYMLCLISIDRYRKIIRPFSAQKANIKQTYLTIAVAYLLSLFWTVMPLLGWSDYDYEGIRISCSIKWTGRSFNIISYNITIFIFVYLVPITIIIVTNTKIYLSIRNRWQRSMLNLNCNRVKHQHKIERHILNTIILIIGGYLIAWTPYAIIVFIRIFIDTDRIPAIVDTLPALFAKSSLAPQWKLSYAQANPFPTATSYPVW
ncbi:unnamed protein product [Adineta ricciae]|uniref:G-protein coupled receptors family 1 profile domain-containing protein n=1 Tax=Adineta ricciae TaxID=249248 RepID=A0A815WQH4_ADIRI|nr:unnamed protein product [Adineta ricciae]